MNEEGKITEGHLRRPAFVYVRQSSPAQVAQHQESTQCQYGFVDRAVAWGWNRANVIVVDDDLGVTATGTKTRLGFTEVAAEVALGRVGIIIGMETSRLARNNAEWYRLLDLCGVTDTLIGDGDGVYHPGLFNDRLILGLKGTMSEAEVHVMRTRMQAGVRNKAARGELRQMLPMGLVWDEDGKIGFHPDASVRSAVRTVFEGFSERGSVRQTWLWMRANDLEFPQYTSDRKQIQWALPTYSIVREVLTNPFYAGAYVRGKTRGERYVDGNGIVRQRRKRVPRSQWTVLITENHEGYIDWETYLRNESRIAGNVRPSRGGSGGAVREGAALLQGIGVCGGCGRKLRVIYVGKESSPHYVCLGEQMVGGRGAHCLQVSGRQIHGPVIASFLQALRPGGLEASLRAIEALEADRDAALEQWRMQVERARYEAQLAERRYRAVDPDNRLVARGLEAEWEERLREQQKAQAELDRREATRPRQLTPSERASIMSLGADVASVWHADTTTDRDRKELLRTLLEEVIVSIDRPNARARLVLRWRGGKLTELDAIVMRRHAHNRTDEDTVDLLRRLAQHYSDETIAGILNRQGRKTSQGLCFTRQRVKALRNHWHIAPANPVDHAEDGELVGVREAARILGVDYSTVYRWLNLGAMPGEQLTPGAPWRIRMTEQLRSSFVDEPPDGYIGVQEAARLLGVTRQTVLQRVKRGELEAVYMRHGRRKGMRIKAPTTQPALFQT